MFSFRNFWTSLYTWKSFYSSLSPFVRFDDALNFCRLESLRAQLAWIFIFLISLLEYFGKILVLFWKKYQIKFLVSQIFIKTNIIWHEPCAENQTHTRDENIQISTKNIGKRRKKNVKRKLNKKNSKWNLDSASTKHEYSIMIISYARKQCSTQTFLCLFWNEILNF